MSRIHAPFLVDGRWRWDTFVSSSGNTHAACAEHAREIGAASWDPSQASVMIAGTVVRGHPSVFR